MQIKTEKQYVFSSENDDNVVFDSDTYCWQILIDRQKAKNTVAPFEAMIESKDGETWRVYLWSIKYCREGDYYKLEYKEY